jgi:hypothetical protein
MPIDSEGKMYSARKKEWQLIEDLLGGEQVVKDAKDTYLPKLKSQSEESYDNYRNRGYLYDSVDKTRSGLLGAAMRKPISYVVPTKIEDYMDAITLDQSSFNVLVQDVVDNLISYGLFGLLADIEPGSETGTPIPYISCYNAQSVINCRVKIEEGREVITWIALRETVIVQDAKDEYLLIEVPQIRELFLDNQGFLNVRIWQMDQKKSKWVPVKPKKSIEGQDVVSQPKRFGGSRMDCIPFVFIGAVKNSRLPCKPPLLGLSYLSLKHYQLSCDYYHGLHFCALPTPWAFGITTKDEFYIGPEKALIDSSADAKCGYMEFTGTGLTAVNTAMLDLKKEMAVLGTHFLEEQKRATEAADTIWFRSQGDTATLSSIVGSCQEGLKQVLRYLCYWLNLSEGEVDQIDVQMNKDFLSSKITSQEITALLQALQAGEISQDTFLYQLKVGEIIPDDRTIEEEKELIDMDNEKRMANAPPEGGDMQGMLDELLGGGGGDAPQEGADYEAPTASAINE